MDQILILVEYVKINLSDDDGQKQFADYNKIVLIKDTKE